MKNIAILMGGTSKEKEISLKSGNTIYKYIDKQKYNAHKVICVDINQFYVIIDSKKIKINNHNFSFKLDETNITFDKVFMMIHGEPGENGQLCSYFNNKKIPYTSSSEIASKLTFNKLTCNHHLKSLGYVVPISQFYAPNCQINYPCIVKPSCSGSSLGISKINNKNNLKSAIELAKNYSREVIIEDFIQGREFTCAVFNDKHNIRSLPITEIISKNEIFDYDAKYHGKSIEETPAKIGDIITQNIQNTSIKIYKDLNLSGIVRIDFIVQNNNPYIIEINTVPGFSEESIVPKMLKCADISIKQFISEQIENI